MPSWTPAVIFQPRLVELIEEPLPVLMDGNRTYMSDVKSLTVMVHFAVFVPSALIAVTVAVPLATAVTIPLSVTAAILLSEDAQMIVPGMFVSTVRLYVSPSYKETED